MDMLDTGVLVCHLARRIQGIAKDVVQTKRALLGDDTVDILTAEYAGVLNGSSTTTDGVKQAQQYLQVLLRSANNHANLLAAAKVSPFVLVLFFSLSCFGLDIIYWLISVGRPFLFRSPLLLLKRLVNRYRPNISIQYDSSFQQLGCFFVSMGIFCLAVS